MRHMSMRNKDGALALGNIVVSIVLIMVMLIVVMALVGPINAAINGHSWDGNGTSCDPDVYTQAACRQTLSGTTLTIALLIPLLIIVACILIVLRELGVIGGKK